MHACGEYVLLVTRFAREEANKFFFQFKIVLRSLAVFSFIADSFIIAYTKNLDNVILSLRRYQFKSNISK